jgi:two-component system, chemotaxis family, response regulator Rcp1
MSMRSAKPLEILLVEDNPGDVRLCQVAIEESRISNCLHIATDGEEAITFLRMKAHHADAPRPDLILLDIHLPKKDGLEVLAEIKADEELRTVPVVMLTVAGSDENIQKACELQADCFITKPFDFERFILLIHALDRLGSAASNFLLMERCVHGASHLRSTEAKPPTM